MEITIKGILKQSSKFTGVNLLSRFISFPVALVVAMVLGPKDFGIIGFAAVYTAYAAFVTVGATSTAFREMPGLIFSGENKRANYIQNVGFSIELGLFLLVLITLFIIALMQENMVIKVIMLLTFIGWGFGKASGFLEQLNFTYKKFSFTAKGRLIKTLVYPILTLSLIFWVGIYTVPIVGIISGCVIITFYLIYNAYNLKITFNKEEAFRLIKIGLILHIGTVLYTLFSGTIDNTIIAAFLSKEELGLYIFSYSFVLLILEFFKDFGRVLRPVIWGYSSNVSTPQEGFRVTIRMSVYFALVSSILIGFLQLGFFFLVNYITIKFMAAQWVFSIIALYIFWEAIQIFPEMILYSPSVNKQNLLMFVMGAGVLLKVGLDIATVLLGYGILGIAVATTISQVILTLYMLFICRKSLFHSQTEFLGFLGRVILPFLVPLTITVLHLFFMGKIDLVFLILISVPVQILAWLLFIHLFYSDYINRQMVLEIGTQLKTQITNINVRKLLGR